MKIGEPFDVKFRKQRIEGLRRAEAELEGRIYAIPMVDCGSLIWARWVRQLNEAVWERVEYEKEQRDYEQRIGVLT